MIPLHLLTDNGFKLISNIRNTNVFNPNFDLKKINYINSFDTFQFPCYDIQLSTGLQFTARSSEIFQGLIFDPNLIKNDLDFETISKYRVNDYLYTPYPPKDLFEGYYTFDSLTVYRSLKSDFYSLDENFNVKSKDTNLLDSSLSLDIDIIAERSFYRFLAVSLVRGKVTNLSEDLSALSFKFNKGKVNHERMKKDLLDFFEEFKLQYEIIEYNKYFYINYIDSTLTSYVESFLKEDYNSLTNIFNNEYQSFFLMYLYVITNNTYYMSQKSFMFYKKIAYNNKLVISVAKNPISSNHNYSLVTHLNSEAEELDTDIIFLEAGYLSKITNLLPISKKGDADYLPEYLLIC